MKKMTKNKTTIIQPDLTLKSGIDVYLLYYNGQHHCFGLHGKDSKYNFAEYEEDTNLFHFDSKYISHITFEQLNDIFSYIQAIVEENKLDEEPNDLTVKAIKELEKITKNPEKYKRYTFNEFKNEILKETNKLLTIFNKRKKPINLSKVKSKHAVKKVLKNIKKL